MAGKKDKRSAKERSDMRLKMRENEVRTERFSIIYRNECPKWTFK